MTVRSNRIVVGVDGSEHGKAALRWAVAEAEAGGSQVEVLLAWQLPMIGVPGAFDREEMESAAKKFLLDIVTEVVPSPPVPLVPLVAEGDPTTALIKAADGADMLVLGSSSKNTVRVRLLGSVTQECAALATCPVVIVKTDTIPD